MITRELIDKTDALKGLSDAQIDAITTLSKNDEDAVIGARFGEVYRQLDATIETSTGVKRNGDEKTYLYLERAAKELNARAVHADELTKQVATLTAAKSQLEETIAKGATDSEVAKALKQAKADFAAVTKQYNELKSEYDASNARHAAELLGVQIDNELSAATAGVKFKAELPTAATSVLMAQAIAKVKALNPEFVDDGNGGRLLTFKDNTGAIMRNPTNQLAPYTAAELIQKELKAFGVLDEGRKLEGLGTAPQQTNQGGGASVDVSGARTRVEAYDIIANALMAQGMVNGSTVFDNAMQQAWKDNNVSALPER